MFGSTTVVCRSTTKKISKKIWELKEKKVAYEIERDIPE